MLDLKTANTKVISKNITIEPMQDGNVVLVANITYPAVKIIGNETATNSINNYMKKKAKDFLEYINVILLPKATKDYMQSVVDETEWVAFQIFQNFVVTYNNTPYVSFLTKINAYVGLEENIKTAYSDSFNTNTGKKVSLLDIINGQSTEQKIYEEIIKQIENSPEEYFPNYKELVLNGMENSNFYISSAGLAVYYNKGYLAPKESSEPLFIIPYSVLSMKI